MSIKPDPNGHYYLVARHSGKVLEIKDASTASDARVQQGAAQKDKSHQRFAFNGTRDGMYAIRCQHSQQVFDVYGISKDDGAEVMQLSWHNGQNQQFRLLDAGEGYVFIEAMHSGKLLGVRDGATGDGVTLVQRANPLDAEALKTCQFRLVLATTDVPPAALPSFKKPTDMMRDVGLGAIGLMPKVGGAFKFIVGYFWPDESMHMLWDQMTQYVERYVDARITEERLTALSNALAGAQKNVKDLQPLNPGVDKLSFFNAAYASINQADRAFFDTRKAEKTLAYLIGMGTLKLSLLNELMTAYETIGTPPDGNAVAHRQWLADAIREYTTAARAYRKEIYDRRMAKVGTRVQRDYSYHTDSIWFRLRDEHDGADYRRHADINAPESHLRSIETKLLATAKKNAQALYDAELDALFAPTLLWSSYGQVNPNVKRETVRVEAGPFGSDQNAQVTLAKDAAIEGVRAYGGTTLTGIAIKVGGAWQSVGRTNGTPSEIELKTGERIVSVYGSADYRLMSIRFETNFGRRAGAGEDILAPRWVADVPAELEPKLIGVVASARTDGVEGITLTWQYERIGEYPALQRRLSAKKRGAKKVAAKKATAKRGAKKTTAKKAVAKKAVAKKAAKKSAPKTAVKKTAAKKAPAKKSPAKKAAAKKRGATK